MIFGVLLDASKQLQPSLGTEPISTPVANHPLQVWALIRNSDPKGTLEKLVQQPSVDGILFYTSLQKVCPFEGQFDWTAIDDVVAVCRASGKPLKLSINGGRWVPDWIYAKGARKFQWTLSTQWVDAGQSQASAPEPWDPVYLDAMKTTAQAAGKRYDNDPTLVEVQITGPSLSNGLEMDLPVTPDEALKIGFTPEKFITAWKSMINVYAAAFPSKKLSLAMHNVIIDGRREDIARTLRSYAQKQLGNRLELLVCYATQEKWFAPGNPAVDIWVEEREKIGLEAQLIDIYSIKKNPPEQIAAAMRRVHDLGSRTIELFSADLLDDRYVATVTAVRAEFVAPIHP